MRFITVFSTRVGDYASLVYFAVFVLMIMEVVVRYLMGSGTRWGLELVIALAGIHYMIAGAQGIAANTHVRVDVIYNLLPRRMKLCMDVLAGGLMFTFVAIVLYYGLEQAYPAIQQTERSGTGWNSMAPTYMKAAIPLGAFLMSLQSLVSIFESVGRLRREW